MLSTPSKCSKCWKNFKLYISQTFEIWMKKDCLVTILLEFMIKCVWTSLFISQQYMPEIAVILTLTVKCLFQNPPKSLKASFPDFLCYRDCFAMALLFRSIFDVHDQQLCLKKVDNPLWVLTEHWYNTTR